MLEKSFALLNGVALLFKASGAKEAVICIEDNKPEAIRILKELLVQAGTMSNIKGFQNIRVEELPTKYPQGGERQLIQGVLKREVPAAVSYTHLDVYKRQDYHSVGCTSCRAV